MIVWFTSTRQYKCAACEETVPSSVSKFISKYQNKQNTAQFAYCVVLPVNHHYFYLSVWARSECLENNTAMLLFCRSLITSYCEKKRFVLIKLQ